MGTTVRVQHGIACPDIGPVCAQRDEPPQHHDQRFWIAELRLQAEYAVTDWLGVELQFPLRSSSTSITYRDLDGNAFVPDQPDIHHRNETLFGAGDPWLSARLRQRFGAFSFSGRLGLTVPLGRTEENPFAAGRAGFEHQHVQFGTGTVDPLLGLEAAHAWERVTARLYGQAQLSLYQSAKSFQAGSRFGGGVAVDFQLIPSLQVGVTAETLTELPERWDGVVEQDGNVGRTDVLLGLAGAWTVAGSTLTLSLRVPVYQHFIVTSSDGGQLKYPGIVQLAFQRPFELLH
ncbi:MAG: hypothetical protein Q8N23_16965 [Archangium sp.]|nr:hypothetical protein [Archangium sp.]MDP3154370.1 hypothetical protein [Archangium sp.]MDP3573025.1 hypothetical protein [Archangium sp.]